MFKDIIFPKHYVKNLLSTSHHWWRFGSLCLTNKQQHLSSAHNFKQTIKNKVCENFLCGILFPTLSCQMLFVS